MPNIPHAVFRATLLLTVFACNGADSDDSANTTATSGTATGGTATGNTGTGNTGDFLSDQYPNDDGIDADPAVLFHDNFEGGWGLWDWPTDNTSHLFIESQGGLANGGASYLRSTVTRDQLQVDQYISSSTGFTFSERIDTIYFRFYARFEGISPNPHHWVRVSAGDDSFDSSGWANNKPSGDEGFWFDFDINNDNVFNFYNYWYNMPGVSVPSLQRPVPQAVKVTRALPTGTATSSARPNKRRCLVTSGCASSCSARPTP